MSSKLQSNGCYYYKPSQWCCHLVNAYEVKAVMVCLQCNNCVIHIRALQRWASHNERYTNLSSFYLLNLANRPPWILKLLRTWVHVLMTLLTAISGHRVRTLKNQRYIGVVWQMNSLSTHTTCVCEQIVGQQHYDLGRQCQRNDWWPHSVV